MPFAHQCAFAVLLEGCGQMGHSLCSAGRAGLEGGCVYRQTDRHGERFILRDLLEGIVGLAVLKSARQTDGWRPRGELLLLLKFTDSRGRVPSSSGTSPFFYHDLQLIGRGPPLYGGQSA